MNRIVNRKRYDVQTSTLVADDLYWDGNNHERAGRNTFLYKSPGGNFFIVTVTMWASERNSLEPVTQDEAIALYEGRLTEHHVPYETVFPGIVIEGA